MSLYDEDGVDGPWERRMAAPIAASTRRAYTVDKTQGGQWMVRPRGSTGPGPTFLTRREAREHARRLEDVDLG